MTNIERGNEQRLRRYALGILPDAERLGLEERLVADPDLFASLKLVEDELIDEYLDHALSVSDRGHFERQLVEVQDLRQRVAVWRLLKEQANVTVSEREVSNAGLGRWLATRFEAHPWWPGALAAALVLLVGGNIWFARSAGRLEEELRRVTPAASESHAVSAPTALSPLPTALPSGASLTLALSPTLRSPESSTPRLVIPPEAQTIRLRLELPSVAYARYSVSFVDQDGTDLLSIRNLTAEHDVHGDAVTVVLATEGLRRGDYRVRVTGSQTPGQTAKYTGWRWNDVATYSLRLSDPAPVKGPDRP
jgi:anti-sigma factor RsiW